MNMNKILLILLSIMVSACAVIHKKQITDYEYKTLPGCIKVNENLFCDETEIRNIDWREYMFWTETIYGTDSDEYKASVPNLNVWRNLNTEVADTFGVYYFRHDFYSNNPVVGITQEQAKQYSNWRSDRVFEFLLISYGVFDVNITDNSPEKHFTIKRYFNGKFRDLKPDTNFKRYPIYSLPSHNDWETILVYSDSINNILQNNNWYHKDRCNSSSQYINSDITASHIKIFSNTPTEKVDMGCNSNKYKRLYCLRGNVSEWSSEKQISFGGGWIDTKVDILNNKNYLTHTANAWTGFRNICKWETWE